MDPHWKNIWEAYPHLFEQEVTTSGNVPGYPTPLGGMLRAIPGEQGPELQIPDEYLELLGLKKL